MITVQDPVGIDPTDAGGHGSGFDRVGAFQVGFQEGLDRCAELIDDPLPLTPLQFLSQEDIANEGNAPFGFGEDELFGFLVPDLNLLYDNDRQERFPDFTQLTLVAVQSADEVECDAPFGLFELGIELCSATGTAYLNEPVARERYAELGDFAPGYLLGVVWAEHAQITSGSSLRGEDRQLQNDCLVGAWVRTVTPDPATGALPEPRDPDRGASISPNDLTEAIQTAIIIGDPSSATDVLGSAFEKINAFRLGALGGIDACS
jgi:predicted metalloprotease